MPWAVLIRGIRAGLELDMNFQNQPAGELELGSS